MTRAELEQKIGEIIQRHIKEPSLPVTEKNNLLDDLGLDSLAIITIVVEIEESFAIEFKDDQLRLENISSRSSLTKIVQELLAENEQEKLFQVPQI